MSVFSALAEALPDPVPSEGSPLLPATVVEAGRFFGPGPTTIPGGRLVLPLLPAPPFAFP